MSRNLVKAFTILFRNFILSISLRIYKFLKIYRISLYQEIVEEGGVCWVFQISRSVDNTDHGIAKRPLSTIPLPDQKTGFSVAPRICALICIWSRASPSSSRFFSSFFPSFLQRDRDSVLLNSPVETLAFAGLNICLRGRNQPSLGIAWKRRREKERGTPA